MDRQIVYPGAIPLETDLLNTNKYAMMGLAKLAAAMMGTTTYLHGLTCTPSSPASMAVNVARGEIYSVQNVDNTAYSSLAADTTDTILKQGIVRSPTAFTLTAPATAGQSINYLIQVTYSDVDSGATVLPYYNAANPSVAYSGPNNAGTAQNTVRSGVCTVALKAGVAATTGTQTTPATDTGYTAAWVITVAQGATTVTAEDITVAPDAPFIPAGGLVSAIQQNAMTCAADTGAANAYAAQFVPALPAITDGMRVTFKAKAANTGASTFAANGGSAYPLYSHAHRALQGGEIVAGGLIEAEWNSTLTAWILCGNSGGAQAVGTATQSNHALQLGQATGRLLGVQVFKASGTYTPTPGTRAIMVEVLGGGGGGGNASAADGNSVSLGLGAGGAGYAKSYLTDVPASAAVIVGSGGSPASDGGRSVFNGTLIANGGKAGRSEISGSWTGGTALQQVGSPGGTASGGNILNVNGGDGVTALYTSSGNCVSGGGGSSFLSGAVRGVGGSTGNGNNNSLGGGGSGANATGTTDTLSGGEGGDGIVIITEYA